MCGILYLPRRTRGPEEILEFYAALDNLRTVRGGDGIGFAYPDRESGSLVIEKGLHIEPAVAMKKAREGPVLAHTRQATVGKPCQRLCGPFEAGRTSAVAHNGHWSGYEGFKLNLLGHAPPRDIEWRNDSATAALAAKAFGRDFFALITGGVWVHVTLESNGEMTAYLYLHGGSFEWDIRDGFVLYGSEINLYAGRSKDITEGIWRLTDSGPEFVRGFTAPRSFWDDNYAGGTVYYKTRYSTTNKKGKKNKKFGGTSKTPSMKEESQDYNKWDTSKHDYDELRVFGKATEEDEELEDVFDGEVWKWYDAFLMSFGLGDTTQPKTESKHLLTDVKAEAVASSALV